MADTTLLAFRLAEDHRVLLPVMVCMDAFIVSHTQTGTDLPDQDRADRFLPPLDLPHRVCHEAPRTIGGLAWPHESLSMRLEIDVAMRRVPQVHDECREAFVDLFGRDPGGALDTFETGDAETVVVASGTVASTAREVVRERRERGEKVGLVKIKMLRPFPTAALTAALGTARRIAVLDRNYAAGVGGIFAHEIRAALYGAADGALIQGYLTGVCGGDVTPEIVDGVLEDLISRDAPGPPVWDRHRDRRGGETMNAAGLPQGVKPEIPCTEECLLRAGNTNCGGCGMSIGLSMLGRALSAADSRCTLVIPACCGIVTAGAFPTTSYAAPAIASTFASAPAIASGVASIRDLNGGTEQVICWAGDGGTYDIGIATLSAAAERNENVIYICYDNEIYGNTGGQRSSATPHGARTTTTPGGKAEEKKDIVSIVASHGVPYAATLSIAHPDDVARKLRRAFATTGFRFLLIHSPCPAGWKSEPGDSVELVRLAVRSGLFPVYEVVNGRRYRINVEPEWVDPLPYFEKQRRFRGEAIDVAAVRKICRERHSRLELLAERFPFEE